MRSPLAGPPARRRARSSVPRIEGLEDRRLLATFTVTNPADSGSDSLRAAITQANLDPDPDTIDFAPSVTGSITLTSALPDLASDLVLSGPGASALTVARSAAPGTPFFRIFTVASGVTVEIAGLTISGGGGVGGGIDNRGTLTVTNSTISGNSAINGGHGGGIENSGTDSRLTIASSVFVNGQGGNLVNDFRGVITSLGHNLFTDRPGVPLDPTDFVNTDPLLGPLADNGGPTFTHALLPGSPAINAAVPIQGVTTDQRGIPRPQGAAPDIGAFELVVPPH